jgi:2-haloacid dehalogenase
VVYRVRRRQQPTGTPQPPLQTAGCALLGDNGDRPNRIGEALQAEGARLAILSNGTPAMLDAAIRNAALEPLLDDVFSVDRVKRFKTDPAVYEMATTAWRVYPDKVSFQSSNRWDVAGATKFGFHTVWINRAGQPDEYRDFPPNLVLPSLDGLLTAM